MWPTFGRLFLRVMMFYSHLRNLSKMWRWLTELQELHPSFPLPTTDESLVRVIIAWQLFPHLHFTLLFICVIWWQRRRQRPLWSPQFTALPGYISWVVNRLVRIFSWWKVLSGAQRLLARRTSKREPITVSQLVQLVACKADAMTSLYNFRSAVICCIS